MKGARFEEAPVFAGCKVGSGTRFNDADYRDTRNESLTRYAVLRQLAKESGDLIASERFRALGFACQSNDPAQTKFWRLLLWGYGIGSKYGTSPARPLLAIMAINAIFFLVYLVLTWMFGNGELRGWLTAVVLFWLRQIGRPFDISGALEAIRGLGLGEEAMWGLVLISVAQSCSTAVLLGLFLQSIYRNFNRE